MERRPVNERDFENLFRHSFDDLSGFVCSYVRDEEVARDIVHDAFMTIWNNRMHLDASQSLRSYLFTLARNYALNFLRHQKVERHNEENIARILSEFEEEMDEYETSLGHLQEKLNELPEKQREVLEKCFVEGKMYKEIAEELDISVNTVKTHLKRALKFLRGELQEEMLLLLLAFSGTAKCGV